MRNKKSVKWKISFFAGIVFLGSFSASIAVACGNWTAAAFVYTNSTNFLETTNNALNPTFSGSPLTAYADSSQIGLLTYETTGEFKFDELGNKVEETSDNLELEGALKVEGFYAEKSNDDVFIDSYERGEPIIESSKKAIQLQERANKYKFTIDTSLKWVNSRGEVQDSLSGKDFERGLETYALSADINYNRNGYLIDLINIDRLATIGYKDTSGDAPEVSDVSYDIENYRSTDDTFTLVLQESYTYTLSLLTKLYFYAIPHNHEGVKAIRINSNNSPIAITTKKDKNGKETKAIDQANTQFSKLYGSGTVNVLLDNSWFAGPYYFSKFSASQIVGELNPYYMQSVGKNLINQKPKIKTYILNYASGNPNVYYEQFSTGQISWVQNISNDKRIEATRNFFNKGLYVNGIKQINRANYIAWTPKPYVFDDAGKVKFNNYVSPNIAKLIFNWHSKESLTFRAALAGLINHYQLSKLATDSGNFQYSSLPYGVFSFRDAPPDINGLHPNWTNDGEFYNAIEKNHLYGFLPQPISVYKNVGDNRNSEKLNINEANLFIGDDAHFKIPYYSFDENGKSRTESLDIDKQAFINVLTTIGARPDNPISLQYKYREDEISVSYNSYLRALKLAIETLGTNAQGNRLLTFNLVAGNGIKPSFEEWYYHQESSLGFSNWSPDYNGVGTWLEANAYLDKETQPATNNHSTMPSILRQFVLAAQDSNATVTQYGAVIGSKPATSIFDNDPRITLGFNNGFEYDKLAIDFLDFLIKKNVLDGSKIAQLISQPQSVFNKNISFEPKSQGDILFLKNYFREVSNTTGPEYFNKNLGIWAGLSAGNALWLSQVADNEYWSIPRSEPGIDEQNLSLVNSKYKVRVSNVGDLNLRDFEINE